MASLYGRNIRNFRIKKSPDSDYHIFLKLLKTYTYYKCYTRMEDLSSNELEQSLILICREVSTISFYPENHKVCRCL